MSDLEGNEILLNRLKQLGQRLLEKSIDVSGDVGEDIAVEEQETIDISRFSGDWKDSLIKRREASITLDDVALNSEAGDRLRRLVLGGSPSGVFASAIEEVVEKGIGKTFLFYGPSGTGKTMAAEAIAGELGRKFVTLGTGEIESPIIGVVEQVLNRFFDHSSRTGDVLILDECDSLLFDRRLLGKVQGSEVNHLLRLIEEFQGVLVLTTNRAPILDAALSRRIAAQIEFPWPNMDQRVRIWRRFLSSGVPVSGGVDEYFLGLFPLSGGQIKNGFLGACHAADSSGDGSLEMRHFLPEIAYLLQGLVDRLAEEAATRDKNRRSSS